MKLPAANSGAGKVCHPSASMLRDPRPGLCVIRRKEEPSLSKLSDCRNTSRLNTSGRGRAVLPLSAVAIWHQIEPPVLTAFQGLGGYRRTKDAALTLGQLRAPYCSMAANP